MNGRVNGTSMTLHHALAHGAIQALVLDVDGVLYCHSTGLEERLIQSMHLMMERLSGLPADAVALRLKQSYHQYGVSCAGHEDIGISAATLAHAAYSDAVLYEVIPCATLQQQMRAVKARFDVVALGSNSILIHAQKVMAARGMAGIVPDDRIITLGDTNFVAKPDPRFFDAVVAATGVAPENTLFVEDSVKNIAALRALGFWTAHITSVDGYAKPPSPDAHTHADTLQNLLAWVLAVERVG